MDARIGVRTSPVGVVVSNPMPARVLVVEDEPAIRRLLIRLLEGAGHVGVPAGSVAEARALLARPPGFELVLCDVSMPDESGLELLADVLSTWPRTAVVMVTGKDDPAVAQTALDLGAYGYVIKPFQANELLVNVANALRRRALELDNRMHQERLEDLLELRTAALRRREARQGAVAQLGLHALYGMELHSLFAAALRVVREHLDLSTALLLQLTEDRSAFVVEAADGRLRADVGSTVPATRDHDAGLAAATELPVRACCDASASPRPVAFGAQPAGGMASVSVVVRWSTGPYGVLTCQTTGDAPFSDDDVAFVQSVANLIGQALARLHSEELLREQALRDPLTGLPNRLVLADRLDSALTRAERRDGDVAVLFIDLDHFKTVNDSFGHRAGDDLLVAVTRRLLPLIRVGDTMARFGGDEFIVLCDDVAPPDVAGDLARRLNHALEEPFELGNDTVFVTASIGIALTSGERTTGEALLRDADAAVYLAKDRGRGRHEFFDATLRASAVERIRTETSLRWALERDELVTHYQPIVDLTDEHVVGYEALVRWNHPDRGLLQPESFIPLSEETGLITTIGATVLEHACRQLVEWTDQGLVDRSVYVNVNVSARQLASTQFVDLVARTLEGARLEPARLRLEITESVLVDRTGRMVDTVNQLHDVGVGIVLDDFGTGYSSLGYIQTFPLDCIKLDRAFVAHLARDRTQRALVGGIIAIARALQLETVVEGIETQEQADAATALGCQLAQGFLYGHPVASAALP
jgi:diguanylate cyclase (GGDEF)-like protein